jgi:hypothetical protein
MNDGILNLIINVLLLAIAIYAILDVIYEKNTEGFFFEKINVRGYILITCAFLVIVVNFFKDGRTEREIENYNTAKANIDSQLQRSQKELQISQNKLYLLQSHTKDIILKMIDSGYINSIKASNIAREEYNLQFVDSLHKVVDSIKPNTIKPQLSLAPSQAGAEGPVYLDKIKNSDVLKIKLVSQGAISYNAKLYSYLVNTNFTNYSIIQSDTLFRGDTFIAPEVTRTVNIYLTPEAIKKNNLMVVLIGTFTKDVEGKYLIPYHQSFRFDFKKNKYRRGVSNFEYQDFIKYLKEIEENNIDTSLN